MKNDSAIIEQKQKREGGLRIRGITKIGTPEKPLVSIITVIYNLFQNNRESFFRQMMDSVINQDYGIENIELIIIDGGSQDGTLDLIGEYVEKGFIDYWLSENDSGIYHAMNKGIMVSSGEYINFIGSDDYFLPLAINLSVQRLKETNADYSFGKLIRIDLNNNKVNWKREPSIKNIFYFGSHNHGTMLVKRECFLKIGFFDERYQIISDMVFVFNLVVNKFKPIFVDSDLICHRDGGISNKGLDLNLNEYKDFRNTYIQKYLNLNHEDIELLKRKLIGNPILENQIAIEHNLVNEFEKILNKLNKVEDKELLIYFQNSLLSLLSKKIFSENQNNDREDNYISNDKWYRFGQFSRRKKIIFIVKHLIKKMGIQVFP